MAYPSLSLAFLSKQSQIIWAQIEANSPFLVVDVVIAVFVALIQERRNTGLKCLDRRDELSQLLFLDFVVLGLIERTELEDDSRGPVLLHLVLLHLVGKLDEIQVLRLEVLALVEDVQDFVEPDLHAAREDHFLVVRALLNVFAFTVVVELLVEDRLVVARGTSSAPALLAQEVAVRVVGFVGRAANSLPLVLGKLADLDTVAGRLSVDDDASLAWLAL